MSSTGRERDERGLGPAQLSLQVITQTLWLLRRYFKLQQESLLWRPKTRPHARMPLVGEEKFMIVNIIAWNVLINDLLIIISIIQKHLKIWNISPSYDCYDAMVNSHWYDVVGVQNLIKLVIADYWLEMISRLKLFQREIFSTFIYWLPWLWWRCTAGPRVFKTNIIQTRGSDECYLGYQNGQCQILCFCWWAEIFYPRLGTIVLNYH